MDQETNLFLPVFSVLAVLTFFFVVTSNSSSNIFASVFDLNRCTKPDYSQVYNCAPSPSCVASGRTFGYGFGLKNNSLVALGVRREGFGYGYCMNFIYNSFLNYQCLSPEFKKVYDCVAGVNYCGDQRFATIRDVGYGYGFARDGNFNYKRSGMGYGKCVTYKVNNPAPPTNTNDFCVNPEFKKVYECSPQVNYCGNGGKGESNVGYGYGFYRDNKLANKRSGMGYGRCATYRGYNSTSDTTSYYFYQYLKCVAGINECPKF